MVHLQNWLLYRGDTLKGIADLRDAQVKILQYFKQRTEQKLYDLTPNKKRQSEKARMMGMTLKKNTLKDMPNIPKEFEYELTNLNSVVGWSRSLDGLPQFSLENIEKYADMVPTGVLSKSTVVKKHFSRGDQLLEEQYVDIGSIFTKQSDDFFCFKSVCGASLRKQNIIIFVVLTKDDGLVADAYCQCLAGRVGTCSHAFAVMKLVAKWLIDKINKIPEPKACTLKPCSWSIPQSRERLEKSPNSSLKIFSLTATKSKINTYSKGSAINNTSGTNTSSTTSTDKGITSSLCDARTESNWKNGKHKLQEMHDVIYSHNKNIPMLSVIDLNQKKRINTSFGTMPVGSVLSNQCELILPDFNIYCNLPDPKNVIKYMCSILYFHENKDSLNTLLI